MIYFLIAIINTICVLHIWHIISKGLQDAKDCPHKINVEGRYIVNDYTFEGDKHGKSAAERAKNYYEWLADQGVESEIIELKKE